MKKSIIAVTLVLPLLAILALAPILVNQAFAQNQMGMPMMSPRQQWMMTNNIDDITCREGLALMVRTSGTPACITPSTYMRFVDLGMGNFDQSIMTKNPRMMQGVISQMTQDPQLMQQMRDRITNDPQQMRQMIGPMLGPATFDPELRQQMIDQMKLQVNQ